MNTQFETDPELLELVRTADPMRDPRVQQYAYLDTEAALRAIAPQLYRPPVPPRGQRRRHARLRAAALAGVVAALVFVVANVTSTGNGSGVPPAQAQTILRHIRDNLAWPAHAIYQEKTVTTVTARDGSTFTSASHEWLSTSPPYNMRLVQSWGAKVQWEQAFVNHRLDLYDPRTNTIYLAPGVAPHQVTDKPQWNSALSEVQSLLSGQPQCMGCAHPNVTINANATLNGKPTIELTSDAGRFSYWISRGNYQPLQSEDRYDSLPNGQGGVGISRYPIARVLTGSAAPPTLLSLQAQHPHAAIDHNNTDYAAVLLRMHHVEPSVIAAIKKPR